MGLTSQHGQVGLATPTYIFLTLLMIFLDNLIQYLAITACSTGFEVWIIQNTGMLYVKEAKEKGSMHSF